MSGAAQYVRSKGLLAAAVVGAGVIIGAAGLYLYHSLEQKKKLKLLQQHMTRLDLTLSQLHQELLALRSKHLNNSSLATSSSSKRSKSRNSLSSSRSGYETEDALNTDDDEFYDLNSEDEDTLVRTLQGTKSISKDQKLFEEVDILMKGDDGDRLNAFNLLKNNEFELSEDPDFLWRYAKAYQIQAVSCGAQKDLEGKKKCIYKGLEYVTKALSLDETNPDVHKWFAILTGMQGDFVSIKQKIQNGYVFQKHVLIAIEFKPQDYSLHHLLGRFKYEVANTSWVQKKMASSMFAELPDVTFSDAELHLLTAEKLNPTPWKENRLFLAKCCIGNGKFNEAFQWLVSAKEIAPKTKEDAACDEEINILMEKYKKYRK